MKSLVKIQNNQIVADSRYLEAVFGIAHRSIYRLIVKHQEQLGKVRFQIAPTISGQNQNFALLTEKQAILLLTYTRSNEQTDKFRVKLVDDFIIMRDTLKTIALNRQNQQWLENREQGKLVRKETTDMIKEFVEYAKGQGSKNADKYFMNISKMENKALFFIAQKFPNLREVMNNRQLSFVQSADTIVNEALREGVEKRLPYKDIYQMAKKRVCSFSELIPRTIIPLGLPKEANGNGQQAIK